MPCGSGPTLFPSEEAGTSKTSRTIKFCFSHDPASVIGRAWSRKIADGGLEPPHMCASTYTWAHIRAENEHM